MEETEYRLHIFDDVGSVCYHTAVCRSTTNSKHSPGQKQQQQQQQQQR
jgi:hypothetical protein